MATEDIGRRGLVVSLLGPLAAYADTSTTKAASPWEAFIPPTLLALAALTAVAAGAWLVGGSFSDKTQEGFSVRRHAGGFGGAGVGWRISSPLARLFGGLALVVLGVTLALARVPIPKASEDAAKSPSTSTKPVNEEAGHSTAASAAVDPKENSSAVHTESIPPPSTTKASAASSGK